MAPPVPPPRYGPPPTEDLSDPVVFDRLRERHDAEIAARHRWCLDNGLTPAHDHVHLAPGRDDNFMVRVCSFLCSFLCSSLLSLCALPLTCPH